jgi:hypothetical protein
MHVVRAWLIQDHAKIWRSNKLNPKRHHPKDKGHSLCAKAPPRFDAVIEVDACQDNLGSGVDAEGLTKRGAIGELEARRLEVHKIGKAECEHVVAKSVRAAAPVIDQGRNI